MERRQQPKVTVVIQTLIGTLFFCGAVTACSSNKIGSNEMDNQASEVEVGMTRGQVISILGPLEVSITPFNSPPQL